MNVNHGPKQSDSQGIPVEPAERDAWIRALVPLTLSDPDVTAILKCAEEKQLRVGVACSGGADSVLLLRWMLAHFPGCHPGIHVLHFDHVTRGGESGEDSAFVERLARTHNLVFVGGKRESPTGEILNENTLRQHRMRFFRAAMRQFQIPFLLTGHHLSDRVESLLMRLARGSGLEGLIAPLPVQEFRDGLRLLRPLLAIHKSRIPSILCRIGQDWREDASNQDRKHHRNFIRQDLIPHWETHSPHPVEQNLGRSIASLAEDAEAIEQWLQAILCGLNLSEPRFPLAHVAPFPIAMRRRSIWRWLNRHGQGEGVSSSVIDAIMNSRPGQIWTLPTSWRVKAATNHVLELVPPCSAPAKSGWSTLRFRLDSGSVLCFPGGNILQATWNHATPDTLQPVLEAHDDPDTAVHLDAGQCSAGSSILVGFRNQGMRYQPLGCTRSRSLKRYLIDQKIPHFERDRLPVIQNSRNDLLWVPGLPPSEAGRVTGDTKLLLRLTYRKTSHSLTH
jgi:tRNA(Ile)-lysidine synthase